jgi:hypothetical protein
MLCQSHGITASPHHRINLNPVPTSTRRTIMVDIKALYQSQEKVTFQYFKDGDFWYQTDSGFLFPVPLSDLAGATLNATDKATLFVRYIRKYLKHLEEARSAQAAPASI